MSKGNGPNKGRNLKKYSDGYDNIDFSKKPDRTYVKTIQTASGVVKTIPDNKYNTK